MSDTKSDIPEEVVLLENFIPPDLNKAKINVDVNERTAETVAKILGYLDHRISTLREANDKPMGEVATAGIRASIAECKLLKKKLAPPQFRTKRPKAEPIQ